MDIAAFRRIVSTFADRPADFDLSRGELVAVIRDDTIVANVEQRADGLFVLENERRWPAAKWLAQRIARLPLLAARILDYIDPEPSFVSPQGEMLDDVNQVPEEMSRPVSSIPEEMLRFLDRKPAGVTNVLYLTSDAGEGKTTIINETARMQAALYSKGEADWLLLPVSLGGRTFMRFDDVVVGTLMNRLRFNVLFYNSFIELVRLGAIVPALDGFEEMFVEGSSGDAISALGNLVQALESSGAAVIAARKAYFQYKSLRAQTRLLDSLSSQSVSFSRLGIQRWSKAQFLAYAEKRGLSSGEAIHDEITLHLGGDHPLLTRAVLVKRLLDVAVEEDVREHLVHRIKADPSDYFRQFIGSIIEREALRVWIDKSGEPAQPLLRTEEHYELLSELAFEMWTTGVERLSQDVLTFVAEIYCESRGKHRVIVQQVSERLKQHALIVATDGSRYKFDHEEFYHFFLGEAIGRLIVRKEVSLLSTSLSQAVLPAMALESAARFVSRSDMTQDVLLHVINELFIGQPRISLVKENICGLAIEVFDLAQSSGMAFEDGAFPANSLAGRHLKGIDFRMCYFQRSSLTKCTLEACVFEKCEFEGLEGDETTRIDNVTLRNCKVVSFSPSLDGVAEYVPVRIESLMRRFGFAIESETREGNAELGDRQPDESVVVVERMLRAFMRSTGVNEGTLHKRLGVQAPLFFDSVLPSLIELEVVQDVPFRGGGNQRRFRLGVPLEQVANAIEECNGDYEQFLSLVRLEQN